MRDPSKIKVVGEAENLVVLIYQVTKTFPRDERFGLIAQARRSAVSIGSNIVEGCHRQGNRAFLAFLYQALGSAAELGFQLTVASRLGFGKTEDVERARNQAERLKAMLVKLIVALRGKGD